MESSRTRHCPMSRMCDPLAQLRRDVEDAKAQIGSNMGDRHPDGYRQYKNGAAWDAVTEAYDPKYVMQNKESQLEKSITIHEKKSEIGKENLQNVESWMKTA